MSKKRKGERTDVEKIMVEKTGEEKTVGKILGEKTS